MPTAAHKRGFFFWTLSPFLLVFVIAMPFLIPNRDAAALATLAGLETTGVLMLLGLWNPDRFVWAWRSVGGMVFIACACYVVAMVIERNWQRPQGQGGANLFNAIRGFIAFGLPGFLWLLYGRFPAAFASLDRRNKPDEERI
jgi:hypothetical protein